MIKISNGSKKRCRKKFGYKGIGTLIHHACATIDKIGVKAAMSECIYDYSDKEFYNVMLFLLKENSSLEKLNKFDYL